MRMWMLSPETLCRKHLLGEHVELHMLLGTMRRGKSIRGFLEGGLIDPRRLYERHEQLAREMERRGYRHRSPMDKTECEALVRGYGCAHALVDAETNAQELKRRCPDCARRAFPSCMPNGAS